jgi:hydroxymethylpyrimidine pyrophosphatase-like HAD family hydrolase
VANAREEVRVHADHVCASNDEAGVGRYLEGLLAQG